MFVVCQDNVTDSLIETDAEDELNEVIEGLLSISFIEVPPEPPPHEIIKKIKIYLK